MTSAPQSALLPATGAKERQDGIPGPSHQRDYGDPEEKSPEVT